MVRAELVLKRKSSYGLSSSSLPYPTRRKRPLSAAPTEPSAVVQIAAKCVLLLRGWLRGDPLQQLPWQ